MKTRMAYQRLIDFLTERGKPIPPDMEARSPRLESSENPDETSLALQDESRLLGEVRANPDSLEAHQLLIRFLTGQGRPVPADVEERSLRLGMRENPGAASLAYSLVSLLIRTGRAPMPDVAQEPVAERAPDAQESALLEQLLQAAERAAQSGDNVGVYAALWQMVERVPESALGWSEYARRFAERGAFEHARIAVDRARAMAPLVKRSRESLARACELCDPAHADGSTNQERSGEAFNAAVARIASAHLSLFWGDRLLTLDKSAGFLEDPVFRAAFESIRGSHEYDQYGGKDTIAWRLHTLCWAAKSAARIEGDFVECGVFKGDMASVVLQVAGIDSGRRFYLYDSFEGFSPEWSSDRDFPEHPGFIDFANRFYRQKGLHEYVVERFARTPQVRVVKGFVPEAFRLECPERVAFLHVDLNSPRAEVAVLERLWDRIPVGGTIVFDDYGWKLFHRQKEAEDEFMRARGHEILELPTGQGLVVKRS